jgi:hypothetical protein
MGIAFALGLGLVLGSVPGWIAGKRYVLFQQQRDLAMEHWGVARKHWAGAAGPVGLFLLVIVGGIVIMIFGS